ncbi:aromatic amino acid transaminase [Enterovirga sp. GCM10030262]|uniref:aromatic amino acid transaminase n=1 Tax=Enterovirga sp. GCM10030262 TaxID=3273391 RepID=UPI00361BCD02
MFDRFAEPLADPLHAVMARFRSDPRPDKVDLGVGVYRDETGHSPIMRAVKEAEGAVLAQEDSKAYQALHGDDRFVGGMTELVFGRGHPALDRLAAIQGTGGTGALRIALDAAFAAHPATRMHLGLPSWPNHATLAGAAGMELVTHRYFDFDRQAINLEAVTEAAESVQAGDLFVFHGPCHNPTGADLSRDDRRSLFAALVERGAVPIIDAAYYGLGDGLEADLEIIREAAATLPRALIAVSCSKAFGLYRERVGILFALCVDSGERDRVQGQMERISRSLVSMPPAHGAATVAQVLADERLRASWEDELAAMRRRLLGLRDELGAFASEVSMLRHIQSQRGIFSMLPLTEEQTVTLGRDHAIHMPQSGRINIAGLKTGDAERLAVALSAVTR